MILGIGTDIIEICRVEKVCQTVRGRTKIFTPAELAYGEQCGHLYSNLAGIFGAKEAVSKALGTGFRGFSLQEVEVLHDSLGKPLVVLHGAALIKAQELGIATIHVSISHHQATAVAFVVAEA